MRPWVSIISEINSRMFILTAAHEKKWWCCDDDEEELQSKIEFRKNEK